MHGSTTGHLWLDSRLWLPLCFFTLDTSAWSAKQYDLSLPSQARRTFNVASTVQLTGTFHTQTASEETKTWNMTSKAEHRYRERRIPGTGRQAAAFRSLRIYDKAESQVRVARRTTSLQLHPQLKVILACGRRDGVELFSSRHLFRREDLDLLNAPGDSLAVQSLLPRHQVAIGDTWQTQAWSLQMLSDLDTLLDGHLRCELKSVTSGLARVALRGMAEGATVGTKAKLTFDGHLIFDLQARFLREFQLTQTEQRSAGTVSPGMEITARINSKWSAAPDEPALSDAAAAAYPLNPPESMGQLSFVNPGHIRFRHARDWHVYHQSRDVTILRLLARGRLVAQCNVRLLPATQPGQYTSKSRFVSDIRSSLGKRLDRTAHDQVADAAHGPLRFRIVAHGRDSGQHFRWIYYLFADPDGRQSTFMFTVADSERERFSAQDQQIANSFEFDSRNSRPPVNLPGK
ncbi:MAG: hypothetical protein ABGZ17_29645 [Planctomycetaceae bacterium]